MIEVLVSMLVLAIGVMGFAALQTRAVRASGDSYYRSQAMAIAQDLAERVRLNNEQMAYYRQAARWPATAQATPPDACRTVICTTQQMADFDAAIIRYNAQTLLPQGLVRMETCQGTGAVMSCIYVAWGGLEPTAGATGQCVDANGRYRTDADCVMLEVL